MLLPPGFRVGQAQDTNLLSGVTVVLPDIPAVAASHVMGGAPGTRETDLLMPEQTVQAVDALALSGGSAFGLDAASGVQAWLRQHNRGYPVGNFRVPIVPAAILYDLGNGGDKDWGLFPPYRELGYQAVDSCSRHIETGSVGAGVGATTANARGGLGFARTELADGIEVAAIAICNAVGSVFLGDTQHFWAAPFEKQAEFGGRGWPSTLPAEADKIVTKGSTTPGSNTTLAVVMTNVDLTRASCKRMAINAHDGFARAIYPVHTPSDGDIVFVLSSQDIAITDTRVKTIDLFTAAANTVTRAIAQGVFKANSLER